MSVIVLKDAMADLSREELELLGEALEGWLAGLGFEVADRRLREGARSEGGNRAVLTVHRAPTHGVEFHGPVTEFSAGTVDHLIAAGDAPDR